MFGFLKEKLKNAVSVFSKKVREEVDETAEKIKKRKDENGKQKEKLAVESKSKKESTKTAKREQKEALKRKKGLEEKKKEKPLPEEKKAGFFKKLKEKFVLQKEEGSAKREEPAKEEEKGEEERVEEKKGFFHKVSEVFTTKTLSESKFEEIFWDLEVALLENNVAVSVIEKIKEDMKTKLVNQRLKRGAIEETIISALKEGIDDVLSQESIDFFKIVKSKKPFVICFFGINGSGKTTSIAKLAYLLKKRGFSVVLAAADTFRAAAIDQLQKHGDNIGIKVIKHEYGADAAAVAYDAIQYAKAKNIDVVLIDTAGRSHANVNLMDELKKIIRVANPDLKIFVGDSLTGNDMVEQAEKYSETTGIDGIILAKADVDEKGGAVISAAYVTKKPVYFLGTGQGYGDIQEFDKKRIIENLGF